ncbi:hypothetical protein N8082_02160 [Planktomarina temperata]|nr:hypothetical protein [Planktomarina temperata]
MFKKVSEHLCLEKETMTIQQHASFDSSAAELNATSKLVKSWESKNAKNAAKAGGVSLMALSLAACGGSDSTTTAVVADPVTPVTPVAAAEFDLTPLTDTASKTIALNGSLANDFRFTDGNDVVNGMSATMASADTLLDSSTTDNDTLNLTLTTASGQDAITTINIETVNANMAAASASLDAAAMTGVTAVNVTGVVDGALDDVASAATIKLDGYTRALTINDANYTGTTAAGNADVLNLEVSGTTFGTTAATQSKAILTATAGSGTGGTLETLNITSSGTAANVFNLDAGSNVALSTVNILGSTDVTVRVAEADVTGLTVDASTATGDVTLRIDGNGTAAAANAILFSGIDTFLMVDSTVGGNNANLTGVKSGQSIVFGDDFDATTITLASATYSSLASSISITLDNETAATDTDIANLTIENTSTLNLASLGLATSTDTSAVNSTGVLDGDFTTINITGDTSLAVTLGIDATETASTTTARTVTIDASENTAFVELDAQTDTQVDKVSYAITGTAGADTLSLNDTAGTLDGGAGNDSLTGGRGADTIVGGAGNDTITSSNGADVVTLGAGVDKIVIVDADVAAVAQIATMTLVTTGAIYLEGEQFVITINDVASTYTLTAADVAGTASTDDITLINLAVTNHINSTYGDTVTASIASGVVKITANTAGTPFTLTVTDNSADAQSDFTEATTGTGTTANTVAIDTNITMDDFVTSATGDVIQLDVSDMNASANVDNLLNKAGDISGAEATVLLDFTNAATVGASDVTAGTNVVKVGFTSAINSAADMLAGMDITLGTSAKGSGTDGLVTMFYDADDGAMKVGLMKDSTSEDVFDETGSSFVELLSSTMSSTEYTALTADNITFIA